MSKISNDYLETSSLLRVYICLASIFIISIKMLQSWMFMAASASPGLYSRVFNIGHFQSVVFKLSHPSQKVYMTSVNLDFHLVFNTFLNAGMFDI